MVKNNLEVGTLVIRVGFSPVFQESHVYIASWKNAADSISGGLSLFLHQGNTYSICSSTCSAALIWLRADSLCTDLQALLIFLIIVA